MLLLLKNRFGTLFLPLKKKCYTYYKQKDKKLRRESGSNRRNFLYGRGYIIILFPFFITSKRRSYILQSQQLLPTDPPGLRLVSYRAVLPPGL